MRRKAEITIEEAAKMIKKDPHYVRLALRQKRFDFGDAIQKEDGNWTYIIFPIKFYRYIGYEGRLENEEVREKIKKSLLAQCG